MHLQRFSSLVWCLGQGPERGPFLCLRYEWFSYCLVDAVSCSSWIEFGELKQRLRNGICRRSPLGECLFSLSLVLPLRWLRKLELHTQTNVSGVGGVQQSGCFVGSIQTDSTGFHLIQGCGLWWEAATSCYEMINRRCGRCAQCSRSRTYSESLSRLDVYDISGLTIVCVCWFRAWLSQFGCVLADYRQARDCK